MKKWYHCTTSLAIILVLAILAFPVYATTSETIAPARAEEAPVKADLQVKKPAEAVTPASIQKPEPVKVSEQMSGPKKKSDSRQVTTAAIKPVRPVRQSVDTPAPVTPAKPAVKSEPVEVSDPAPMAKPASAPEPKNGVVEAVNQGSVTEVTVYNKVYDKKIILSIDGSTLVQRDRQIGRSLLQPGQKIQWSTKNGKVNFIYISPEPQVTIADNSPKAPKQQPPLLGKLD